MEFKRNDHPSKSPDQRLERNDSKEEKRYVINKMKSFNFIGFLKKSG